MTARPVVIPDRVRLTAYVGASERDALNEWAAKHGLSTSEAVRMAVQRVLKMTPKGADYERLRRGGL